MFSRKCVKFCHSDEEYENFQTSNFHKKKYITYVRNKTLFYEFKSQFVTEKVSKFFITLIQCTFSTIIILSILSTTTIQVELHPHFIL